MAGRVGRDLDMELFIILNFIRYGNILDILCRLSLKWCIVYKN